MGADVSLKYIGSLDLLTSNGRWVTMSAVLDTRLAAYKWVENLAWKAYRRGIPTKSARVEPAITRHTEQGQFDFLRGNEACAREWQHEPKQ